jgi:hypothetical protein
MIGILQYLAAVVIIMWAFWRIFSKAGRSPWWSYLMVLPLIGIFAPIDVGMAMLFGVPIVMIWVFAFAPWPSIDNPPEPRRRPGYEPPEPARFRGPFRRQIKPSESQSRRGVARKKRRAEEDQSG